METSPRVRSNVPVSSERMARWELQSLLTFPLHRHLLDLLFVGLVLYQVCEHEKPLLQSTALMQVSYFAPLCVTYCASG